MAPTKTSAEMTRRELLGAAGAGLLITVTPSGLPAQNQRQRTVAARLHLAPDGSITVMSGKVEIGQGSRAELTQAAAEELRVSPDRITMILADTELTPDDGGTAGSRTTPSTVPAVRRGAAAAREILIELARRRWDAADAKLTVENGIIRLGNRSLNYADLAASPELGPAFDRVIPSGVELAAVSQWSIMGDSLARPNARDLVTGEHQFPSDIRRPGMLYGKVLRPPSFGASLTKIDLAPARRLEGVVALHEDSFAGCAAPTTRQAAQAVEAMRGAASWETSPHPSSRELFPLLKRNAVTDPSGRRAPRVESRGSLETGLAEADNVIEAAYEISYIQHAPLEPRAAVAEWRDGRLTVWTGTQQPMRVRSQLAAELGVPEDNVRVIVPDTGGGFGGKHSGETAVEAARLARAAKRPVSLQWTREEEFTWAYFRPAALIETRAGLASNRRLTAWEFSNYNAGASALRSPYDIANVREQFIYCESPLREGSYRVLAATANNFARESFMDEAAAAAGEDPLEFRLAHLQEGRLRDVLKAAAARFRWRERRSRRSGNRGIGLACGTEKGSFVAACVEVETDREQGNIRVLEVCSAFECGAIINPRNLQAQVEGCIIMTLGGALTEEIAFEHGRILNNRFSRYPVPRFRDVPPIDCVLLDRPDLPSVGAGETPMIAVPPAVANAVHDACGTRVRTMPVRGSAIRQA